MANSAVRPSISAACVAPSAQLPVESDETDPVVAIVDGGVHFRAIEKIDGFEKPEVAILLARA